MNVGQLRRALEGLPDTLPVVVGEALEEGHVVEIRTNPRKAATLASRYVFVGADPALIDDGSETEGVLVDDALEGELEADVDELGLDLDDRDADAEEPIDDEDFDG